MAVPKGWTKTDFASPPEVEYPTAISAAANGDVYVSVDKNGSLGHEKDFGKIVMARDTDGDGKADKFQDFVPSVASPRGGHYVGGTFYLIHPPYLSAFRDADGDGVAEEKKELVKGFGWGIEHPRGADHTTNGVRMGIDGWLYVAVGDFGMPDAVGADGKRLTLWGGGVVRVRPDGSEMEVYSSYTRNIYDIAITPTLDMFSRDNTNDGKGWNTRFHHFVPMGNHGYPRLYKNFADEIVTPLKDYGGGSGTGALALNEPGFPEEYDNAIFTTDWTTGNLYHHPMKPMEATFVVEQEVFKRQGRAVDVDVDGSSRLYLADWRNGGFKYSEKRKVGGIQQILPPNWKEREFPDLKSMNDADLANLIGSESAVMRLEAQREMVSRGKKETFADVLGDLAKDTSAHVFNRIAAIFTIKQIYGKDSVGILSTLVADDKVREYALRAMTDRKSELEGVPVELYVKALNDPNPRVRVQALNGLARLGATETAADILKSMADANLDPGAIDKQERRIVPHVAIKALVELGASEACLDAVTNPSTRDVALRALQEMHTSKVVDGLISLIDQSDEQELIRGAMDTLARLYFKEKQWDLEEWWNTRPDDRGPYFHPTEWNETQKIRGAIEKHFTKVEESSRNEVIKNLSRNRVPISELKLAGLDPVTVALSAMNPQGATMELLMGAAMDSKRDWSQRLLAYKATGRAQPEQALRAQVKILASWIDQKQPEAEAIASDFVNDPKRSKHLKTLDSIAKQGSDTESMVAWKSMLTVFNSPLTHWRQKKSVEKILDKNPMEVGLFLAIADMKLGGFEKQIAAGIGSDNEKTISAAKFAQKAASTKQASGKLVGEMKVKEVAAHAMKNKGDAKEGKRLYVSQGCIACHAIDLKAVQKGPYLGDSGAKFERDYLIESILDPNAVVAQGFQTSMFKMKDGKTLMGFVTSEEDDKIEVRDIAGQVTTIKRSEVETEQHLPQSMMPAGLGNTLDVDAFTDLIEYLASLKTVEE